MSWSPLFLFWTLLFLGTACAGAQQKAGPKGKPKPQPEIHNTVALPAAAHHVGERAEFFLDPITQNRVYRLSDEVLCPKNATHFYSYTNQFSPAGHIVFDCSSDPANQNIIIHPIYDRNFKLLYASAEVAAAYADKLGKARMLKLVQWSQEREVLFGEAGLQIIELDPFGGKNRIFADFSAIKDVQRSSDGARIAISTAKDLSVGPGDRLMVHLQCMKTDPECLNNWEVVGVGVFDPATGKYNAIYAPVPGDLAPNGFDEGQWSQNPKGRLIVVYGNAPNFSYSADLSSRVQFDDNHGHRGYFCGSNGRCYMVRVKNDTLSKSGVGQIGCKRIDGSIADPWRAEQGLYDDETGKRVLIWGCDIPGQNVWGHFARSPGAKDVFGISTERSTFGPSLEKFYPTDEAIVRAVVEYAGGEPVRVRVAPVAYHRSAIGPRENLLGRQCGYWATPRVVMDFTGARFLFDSSMSHLEWPATENGEVKADCHIDVYVAEAPPRP